MGHIGVEVLSFGGPGLEHLLTDPAPLHTVLVMTVAVRQLSAADVAATQSWRLSPDLTVAAGSKPDCT